MTVRLIRVSSRATGTREFVRVYVYDEIEKLRDDGERFSANGETFEDCVGLCQTYVAHGQTADGVEFERMGPIVVRLWRERLGTQIVTHEMSHAATEVYGRTLPPDALAVDHMHNANEVLAHLHSDLSRSLVDRLYALGYYSR